MEVLIQNFSYITLPMLVMWGIGGILIYLAIVKKMEPTLLLPMGFGAIYSHFLTVCQNGFSRPISLPYLNWYVISAYDINILDT